jgi:hypothetical protein
VAISRDAVHWNASINVENFDDLQPLQAENQGAMGMDLVIATVAMLYIGAS